LALDFDQLYYFQSSGAYTEVNTIDKKYILSKNLGKIETELDSKKFLRVNHNFIVNKDKIESIEKGKNALINLSNRERIPISQRRYQFVLAAFEHKNPAD
jgi:DNA-binding LytR/AlgR family response regulator